MPLFNAKYLDKVIDGSQPIPEAHLTALGKWARMAATGAAATYKETALDADFKAEVVQGVLGYRAAGDANGQTVAKEYATGSGSVDLALGYLEKEHDVIAPFELKGAAQSDLDAPIAGRRESPVEQAWRYAREIGRTVRWVLVSNFLEIRLYSYREGSREYERFLIRDLIKPDVYAKFIGLLSADALLTGETQRLLEGSQTADKELSDTFYAEYQALRRDIIAEIAEQTRPDGSNYADVAAVSMAQTVLDRILFIAFAEDRGLLPERVLAQANQSSNAFAPQPKWANYLGLFKLIDKGGMLATETGDTTIPAYNGGLFRRDEAINDIQLSDAICEGFEEIGAYDFRDEVDVEVLGHVFEQSLRDLEKHLAIARGLEEGNFVTLNKSVSRVKKDGVVYTPPFVARFITERTLGTHIVELYRDTLSIHAKGDPDDYDSLRFGKAKRGSKAWIAKELAAWEHYFTRLQSVRVVDPACGSGIFLVTAFEVLKREYERALDKLAELRGGQRDLFDADRAILTRNIYGVDVNEESLEISKLALWIKTAKRDKPLDDLDHTLRVGDSLIEDNNYAYLEHGFTWRDAFPEVFADGGFDVVLGNPPYVRMELIKAFKPDLEKRYEVVSDRADLYAYFYERGVRLLKPGGRLGFISNNTFFKTGSGRPLREYLLGNAEIELAANFGDVQIFEGVTTYPVILVLRRADAGDDHAIRYWNVPRVPKTEFGDAFDASAADYPQAELGSGSWELEPPALRELRAKIVGDYPTLEEMYGAPLYGIKTGLNAAFVIDRATRDRLVAEDPRSEELLRPWLEGKDIRRWCVEPRDLFVVYIPKNRIEIADYPAVRNYLQPFREYTQGDKLRGLEHRATVQEWFELQQAQMNYVGTMSDEKIVFSRFLKEQNFALDNDGYLINNALWAFATSDKALLAYLNSKVLWFQLIAESTNLSGGFSQADAEDISICSMPFKLDSEAASYLRAVSQKALALASHRLSLQNAVKRRLPDLCPLEQREPDGSVKLGRKLESWWEHDFDAIRAEIRKRFRQDIPLAERSDWEDMMAENRREIARLSAEIDRAEARIDARVYELFALTEAEIALLEGAI